MRAVHRALDGRTLVFLHIPKTGGATLRRILFRIYGEDACYWIKPSGTGDRSAMHQLMSMSSTEKRQLRVVTGHVPYGVIDRILPQPTMYVTVLRDPVERLRSLYQYVRRSPDHPMHGIAQASLAEFRAASRPPLDNHQTRLLAGGLATDPRQPVDRPVCSRDFEHALEHLRRFAIVGVQERFTDAVSSMGRLLGWGAVPAVESTHVERSPIDVDPSTRSRVVVDNRFDVKLHRAAQSMQDELEQRASSVLAG